MGEKIKIITPEFVELEYELAGIGSRLMALLIDVLIQLGVMIALYLIVLALSSGAANISGAISNSLLAFYLLASFLVIWAYTMFFEIRNNGQTPGKKKMKLRVIRQSGHPINLQASFIRNAVRIADYAFALGFFVMFISKNSQRLGDYAAKTVVVKERSGNHYDYVPLRSTQQQYKENYRILDDQALSKISRLSKQDYERLSHFRERISAVRGDVADDVAYQMAVPILRLLEMPVPGRYSSFEFEAFLSEVAQAYQRHMGQ